MFAVSNPSVFSELPERGMGYHLAKRVGDNQQIYIVYNHILALSEADLVKICAGDGEVQEQFSELIDKLDVAVPDLNGIPAETFVPLTATKVLEARAASPFQKQVQSSHTTVHGSPPHRRVTRPNDKFVRFSSFRNDRRVSSTGFIAGTYVTSESDVRCVPNALAAVGRYALPSASPPIHVFTDRAHTGTSILIGAVSPAYGQAGGGAAIEFQVHANSGKMPMHSTIDEY